MQTFLLVFVIIIIAIIGLGMLIYFLLSKRQETIRTDSDSPNDSEGKQVSPHLETEEVVNIIDVKFKGYAGKYTYATPHNDVKKDQCVLVLTQDGIRCARVVSSSKGVKVSDLTTPLFLLQSIICVADESDLEYYQ